MNAPAPSSERPFTPAQTLVIAGYARGQKADAIATSLGISSSAVRNHTRRASKRIEVRNRSLAALVDHAYASGAFDGIPDLAVKRTPHVMPIVRSLQQVLDCLVRGMSTNGIALELAISRSTAREYRRRLFAQLGTDYPPHAVARAWQMGLRRPARTTPPMPEGTPSVVAASERGTR
ncbi:LuxR C-terminal-related transcriptional regulator [Streptomyces sp. NPDC092369]|uniref:LuxR C-terminal-related transcriptional regulator n=1 Tax=Streptomyces sp. NPDC092369 TaxID=3366015 RepID=UPI00381F90C2